MNLRALPFQTRRGHGQQASAVIVVIVLIGIVLIYIAANLKSLAFLKQEIKLVERRQIQRLNAQTNALPTLTATNGI